MKRQKVELASIAAYPNLILAANKAARGKRTQPAVVQFFFQPDLSLQRLREDILTGRAPEGRYRSFYVFDPKKRLIQAASFKDRVLHHAIINIVGPSFERALIPTTYACRPSKGTHAALKQVQLNSRRFPWYVQIDIHHYFDHIDHQLLMDMLARRFKGAGFIKLLARIITSYAVTQGKGLPIGSLTSQHFANYYLNVIDRLIIEQLPAQAYVRYMDDMVWWCQSKALARQTLLQVKASLMAHCRLTIKPAYRINQSKKGISYCGSRILPGEIRLGKRSKKRYAAQRKVLELAFSRGEIDARQLQAGFAAVLAPTLHADSLRWRQANLIRQPSIDV